ncbi:MAG TPA: hypothetical protein GXX72_00545 [Clostridiaceae bacterium]|nr:hypothetical protein [Clostridiaceae bacterium]
MNHRKALQMLWKGRCTITIWEEYVDPVTKRTKFREVVAVEDEPCKLSFETVSAASEHGEIASVGQVVKLFLAPEIEVPPGSKITVTQNGVTTDYANSGQPAIYTNHQEIILTLYEEWA